MLFTLGIDSQFGTLEGVVTSIVDMKLFPNLRKEILTGSFSSRYSSAKTNEITIITRFRRDLLALLRDLDGVRSRRWKLRLRVVRQLQWKLSPVDHRVLRMHRSVLRVRVEKVKKEIKLKLRYIEINVRRFADDIELMTGNRPGLYWLICWKYLSPMAMLSILIASIVEIIVDGSGYPAWVASKGITEKHEWPVWALGLIGILILASVLWIPAVAICR